MAIPHKNNKHRDGFTLVELLVVITIIVILLAMLVPAMEKAIYQAELATCATRMKGVAQGATIYAMENHRRYMNRDIIDQERGQPYVLAGNEYDILARESGGQGRSGPTYDDRPRMQTHIPMSLLVEPLAPKIDYSVEATGLDIWVVHSGYSLYFGVDFAGYTGMKRVGDRFEFRDGFTGRLHRYSLLAADLDMWVIGDRYLTSHPDDAGVLPVFFKNGEGGLYTSRYDNHEGTKQRRGLLDQNYAYADGGVTRLSGIEIYDSRTATVPYRADSQYYPGVLWVQLPKE